VWKGEHCGREVAVKVIRTYTSGDLQKVIGVSSRPCYLPRFSELTKPHGVEVLQGGCDMEEPSASKRPTINRCDDGRNSVRNGIRLDGEREYQ